MSGRAARWVSVYRPGIGMVYKRRESHYRHGHKQNLGWTWRHEALTGIHWHRPRVHLSRAVHRARRKARQW